MTAKSKLIREFIDKNIEEGFIITMCFEENLNRVKFLEEDYTEVIGSNENEIIGSNENETIVFDFKDLFNSTYGSNATLFVSDFFDYGEGYSPFFKVFKSMNLNTLEVKEIDFEIY
jgi:hypothetical protein